MNGTVCVGPGSTHQRLTAPEYAVLLADNRPTEPDVVRAALVEVLARGVLGLEPRPVVGRRGVMEQRLLVAGPRVEDALPPVLEPVRAAMSRARTTQDSGGGQGVDVAHWAVALRGGAGPRGYVTNVVRPSLLARGLLVQERRRYWVGTRLQLSSDGRGTAAQARVAVEQARVAAEVPADGWQADPAVAAAAVAALGALGVLALADRGLVAALVELRRAASSQGGAVVGTGGPTGDPGRQDDAELDDLDGLDGLDGAGLDAVDAGVDAGSSGGSGSGSDGGSDGGGDGGGGGGGGD